MSIFHGPRAVTIEPIWLTEDDQGNPTGVNRPQYRATVTVEPDPDWFPGKPCDTLDLIEDDATGADL